MAPMRAPAFRATVAALAIGQIVCWAALFYAFTSLVLPMQRELGWSRPQLMGAFTVGRALWGAATYAMGAAVDRGHDRLVLTGGTLLGACGFVLWSQAHSLAALYAAWALLGIAMAATLYEPAFNAVTKRFPEHFRKAILVLTLVGGFASTLSFPSVAALIAALGWRGALLAIAALLGLVIAPLHAWALQGAPHVHAAPIASDDGAADATLHEALRRPAFWFLTIAFSLHAFVLAAVFAHLMPAVAEKGLSEAQALAVLVWFGPAQVAGRFAWGALGSGRTPRALALTVLAGTPLALAIFAVAERIPGLLAFTLVLGLANGLVTIVRGSLVPDYFGRGHVGRISGAMSAFGLLGRAVAPFAVAWLLVPLHVYASVLWLLAALGVLAVACYALAGPAPRGAVSPTVATSREPMRDAPLR
jgi:MFS family permease